VFRKLFRPRHVTAMVWRQPARPARPAPTTRARRHREPLPQESRRAVV